MPDYVSHPEEGVAIEEEQEVETPRLFKVLLHNDNYTTMDFVVMILEEIFGKPRGEAVRIMLNVHEKGLGVAGVYIRAIAETKVATVHRVARHSGFPLKCSMAPE